MQVLNDSSGVGASGFDWDKEIKITTDEITFKTPTDDKRTIPLGKYIVGMRFIWNASANSSSGIVLNVMGKNGKKKLAIEQLSSISNTTINYFTMMPAGCANIGEIGIQGYVDYFGNALPKQDSLGTQIWNSEKVYQINATSSSTRTRGDIILTPIEMSALTLWLYGANAGANGTLEYTIWYVD